MRTRRERRLVARLASRRDGAICFDNPAHPGGFLEDSAEGAVFVGVDAEQFKI